MKKILLHTLHRLDRYRHLAVILLLLSNVILAGSYMYLINTTIYNAVNLSRAQTDVSITTAHIAELESKYSILSTIVTLDYAYSHGFTDASMHQMYINEKPVSHILSFNAL